MMKDATKSLYDALTSMRCSRNRMTTTDWVNRCLAVWGESTRPALSAAYQKSWRNHRAVLGATFVGICVLLSAMYMYCCPKKKTSEEELAKKKRVDDTARKSVALGNMGLKSRAAARIELNDLESAEETTPAAGDPIFTSNPMRKL